MINPNRTNLKTKDFYDEYLKFCADNEKISFSDFISMKNYLMWSNIEERAMLDVGLFTLQNKGAEMKIDVYTYDD